MFIRVTVVGLVTKLIVSFNLKSMKDQIWVIAATDESPAMLLILPK